MPSEKSYRSQKGDKKRKAPNQDPRFSFAPAFAASRSTSEANAPRESASGEHFQYMIATSATSDASWSTIDPESRERKWNANVTTTSAPINNSETPWTWTSSGTDSYQTRDGTNIASEVRAQFIGDSDIMNEKYQSKTTFEHRNTAFLGNSGNNQIVSMIGGTELALNRTSETRFVHMDKDGNYIDGKDRGQPKKRHMEEHQRRVIERDAEMKKANAILDEWKSLTPQEQAARKAKAELNRQITQATLAVDAMELSEMPKIYQEGIQKVAAKTLKYNSQQARAQTSHGSTPAVYNRSLRELSKESRSYQSSKASAVVSSNATNKANDDFFPIADDAEDLIFLDSERHPAMSTYSGYHRHDWIDESLENNSLLDSESDWRSYTARSPSSHSVLKAQSSAERATLGLSSVGHSSTSRSQAFKSYASMIPVEDTPEHLIVNPSWSEELKILQNACESYPRVVSLALTDENVAYTSKAIVERLFGCSIQEIQFFPTERQAIIVFLHPSRAEMFLTHVASARAYSEHEARRLQFDAKWYQGAPNHAILPATASVLSYTFSLSATRTLSLKGLSSDMTPAVLLDILQLGFQVQHVVKAILIRPSKNYERELDASLQALLEFASIPHAIAAKNALEAGAVPGFPDISVSFSPDASEVAPPWKPWCKCMACKQASTRAQTDAASYSHNAGAEEYDPLNDALVPESFAYVHEEAKKPRLTSYDKEKMLVHARNLDR